ncbi:hypothetical protein Dsin_002063 [Dipteronia sinensis]|uniref:Reverse transcriptase n=1 Tax=Dipteronia sinensis TaxID=43782 RepID=A0AAE0EJK7_9ROSI|nr:hypothetical protein Dsin_002063 [Dipteronia sinensis]
MIKSKTGGNREADIALVDMGVLGQVRTGSEDVVTQKRVKVLQTVGGLAVDRPERVQGENELAKMVTNELVSLTAEQDPTRTRPIAIPSPRAFNILRMHKEEANPALMFLLETKCHHEKLENWKVKLGFVGKLVVDCIGRAGGLCLYWSQEVIVELLSYLSAHIDVRIRRLNNKSWRRNELTLATRADTPSSWRAIRNIEEKLDEVLSNKQRYWCQRAKIEWMKSGDRNSGFFHAKASTRRVRVFGFLICAEGLSCLIQTAQSNGNLTGLQCSKEGPVISHLFFAYDNLLFTKANKVNCLEVRQVLAHYERMSGQDQGKMKGCGEKLLPVGGKDILIKAVIQSIPAYAMSKFRLLKCMIGEIQRLCARFRWGGSKEKRKMH